MIITVYNMYGLTDHDHVVSALFVGSSGILHF